MQYRSFEDLSRLIHGYNLNCLQDFDLIVGVPRSGMIPAYLFGLILNLPVIDIESFIAGVDPYVGKRLQYRKNCLKKILVVDDSIKFGGQLNEVKKKLNYLNTLEFKYLSVFATSDTNGMVDHCLEIINKPRVFQWNLLNSWIYEYSCVDIDGVLCEDPSEEENDDGEKYLEFLLNARPKYTPPCKIDVLVTSRLEKYRSQTEVWLSKNGILYNNLEMLNVPDKKTRVRLGIHASFKADIYKKYVKTALFIESSKCQSETIHSMSGKNVFCVENMLFYSTVHKQPQKGFTNLWRFLKKV